MAIRQVRIQGDDVLTKVCRPIKEVTPRIATLIEDMIDTMYEKDGVGLAAPQVGVLRRVAVVDVGDGPIVLINPEVLETSGSQTGEEGCLSLPGKSGQVTRPNYAKVRAYTEHMEAFEVEGQELLASALLPETEHLDGHMYTELVEGGLHDVSDLTEEEA